MSECRHDRFAPAKIIRGDLVPCGELLVEREYLLLKTKHTTQNRKMKTLIKTGALLALIAGLGIATTFASDACKSCQSCAKSCGSCAKCSDGKCSSCCK
jgi:hypothetical protein